MIQQPIAVAIAILALANGALAGNPWSSAIGEAAAVQRRAEDIANRIKKTAPHGHLVRQAMAMDQLACGLLERIKCGASPNQVEGLYHQLQGNWNQLRVAIYTDQCLCTDRHLKSLSGGMDTRMRNLCKAIERVIAREFRCAPSLGYNAPSLGYNVRDTYRLESHGYESYRVPFGVPFGVPSNSIRFGVPAYPQPYPQPYLPPNVHRLGPNLPRSLPPNLPPSLHRLGPNPGFSGPGFSGPGFSGPGFSGPGNWRAY
jgi:hypothetical protein